MLSAYLFYRLSPIKISAKIPTACFILLQKGHLLSSSIFARGSRNDCCANFCSLAEAIDSGYGVKSRTANSALDEYSHSYIVPYLVNSCGLPAERANFLSKRVTFKSLEKPNAVLAFLRDQGFSKAHIAKLVGAAPQILFYNPEKILLPKIEFFSSIWVSRSELTKNLSANHHLLRSSLKNKILPLYHCLKSMYGTDDRLTSPRIWRAVYFSKDPTKNLASNIAVLRELGVRESCIRSLMTRHPAAVMVNDNRFREVVYEVKNMGFDHLKSTFVQALYARFGMRNRLNWERCCEVYRSWGWSEDLVRNAYGKDPNCMLISEQKLSRMMDFLVNKMGLNSQTVARYPVILNFSLDKRIIPRGSVIHLLRLKGFIRWYTRLYSIFIPGEKYFLSKFVIPYEKQVPQLRDVYQGKMGIFDV